MAKDIQSVIFSKEKGDWTLDKAKKWLKDHDLHSEKVDETEQSWRFRQFPPSECTEGSYQTLTENFPEGISAVACSRKKCEGDYEMKLASLKKLLDERIAQGKALCTDYTIKEIEGKETLVIWKSSVAEIKKVGEHEYLHPISDAEVDRDGDILTRTGWDTKDYKNNPVVMFGHDYSKFPIGLNRGLQWKQDGRWWAKTWFDSEEDEFAAKVESKFSRRVMPGSSVGFIPEDWEIRTDEKTGRTGVIYHKKILIEYSIVPIPANPRAIASVGKAIEEEIEKKDYEKPKLKFNLLEPNVIEPLTKDEKELIKRAIPAIAKLFKASEPSKDSSGSIYDLILGDHGEEPNDPDRRNLSEDDIARMIALKLKLASLTKTMKT